MSAPRLLAPTTISGGAPVGGSGTLNYVAKWTATGSTLTDSIIAQNAGSTGIAIGDIAGVSYVGLVQIKKAGGAGWLTLDHTGGSYAEVQSYNVPLYLNRQGNNTILNSTSGSVGIGTTSPVSGSQLTLGGAANGTYTLSYQSASGPTEVGRISMNSATGEMRVNSGITSGFGGFTTFYTAGFERMRIDSSGRLLVGTGSVAPSSGGIWAIINQPGGAGGQEWHNSSASPGGAALIPSQNRATWYVYQNALGSETYSQSCVFTPTGIDLNGAATPGLKLPATPGNADTQTLDCYQENTWTATDGSGAGLTFTANNTAVYTRVGRLIHVRIDITFPTTASGANALVNLPFNAINYGGTAFVYASGVGSVNMLANGSGLEFYTAAGARMTNGALSTLRIIGSIVYQAS